jgi:hypothetical protein
MSALRKRFLPVTRSSENFEEDRWVWYGDVARQLVGNASLDLMWSNLIPLSHKIG